MKLFSQVHCHVCPLKDLCDLGDAEISYKRAHCAYDECCLTNEEEAKMDVITLSCPLRKALNL